MEREVRRPVRERLSVEVARRIALAGQGFAEPRPSGRVDARHVRRVLDRVGVLQLDSVNVVCRSHYLPVFARLGPYPRPLLDEMAWGSRGRELFEYWGHQASLLPLGVHPLVRWRMQAAQQWNWETWSWPGSRSGWRTSLGPLMAAPWAVLSGMMRIGKERPGFVDAVLAVVRDRGPVAAGEANPDGVRHGRPSAERGAMWNWADVKIALEWLFFMGKVTTATRRRFERIYDLTERVLPPEVLAAPTPSADDAQRELLRIAARAQGVATERQLREYFHLRAEHAKPRIAELVDAGELVPVGVEGVSQGMYLWPDAAAPSRVWARALLSPFDSLIWDRDRTLRLFDFHYRISIYTPAAERTHGYYVMPFLLGDRLVARVDLKADRQQSALLVRAAHAEPEVRATEVAAELAAELRLMASWLELDRVAVNRLGDLGPALAGAVNAGR
ncbi:MAG: winged helix-turn-helix domain-containing protein [Chloroflexota bacterium]